MVLGPLFIILSWAPQKSGTALDQFWFGFQLKIEDFITYICDLMKEIIFYLYMVVAPFESFC
jgi:hypothetical protein